MSNKFYPVSSTAADIKNLLVQSGLFQDVRRSTLTSYEQLLRVIPELTRMPAAVVCIGGAEFPYAAATRQFNPAVVIVDRLQSTLEDRSRSIWDLLDSTLDLFMTENPGEALEINGVSYIPENFEPVVLGGQVSAYLLTLHADCSR